MRKLKKRMKKRCYGMISALLLSKILFWVQGVDVYAAYEEKMEANFLRSVSEMLEKEITSDAGVMASGLSETQWLLIVGIIIAVVIIISAIVLVKVITDGSKRGNTGGGKISPPVPSTGPSRLAPKPAGLYICGIIGVLVGNEYPIANHPIVFGRIGTAMIRFSPDTKGISREHCVIMRNQSGQLVIMDCGSSYGTYLQDFGKLIPQQPVEIRPGSKFYLGSMGQGFEIKLKKL